MSPDRDHETPVSSREGEDTQIDAGPDSQSEESPFPVIEKKKRKRPIWKTCGVLFLILIGVGILAALIGQNENTDQEELSPVSSSATSPTSAATAFNSTPPPVATLIPDEDLWQPAPFTLLYLEDLSFGNRKRFRAHVTAPEALTPERRVGTAMAAARALYWQGHVGDVVSVLLWGTEEQAVLLAQVLFAADQCGWTGEDCTEDYWTEAEASSAQYTDAQWAIRVAFDQTYDRFMQPELVPMYEGQPLSEAGWDCFEIIEIPPGGGCFSEYGMLWEGQNKTDCETLEFQWLVPSMGTWGALDNLCAQDKVFAAVAAALAVDPEEVETTLIHMLVRREELELPAWLRYRDIDGSDLPELDVPPTPAPTPSPTSEPAWYEGGTLHQGTLADWRRATVANRLATVGDMVYVLLTRQGEQNLDLAQIRVYAEAMVAGVDEMAKDDTFPDDAAISEIIALIWLAIGVE